MSIWLADVQGAIVKAIVNRNVSDFIKRVTHYNFSDIICVDIRINAIRSSLFSSQLSYGLLHKTAGSRIQGKTN